MRYTNEVSVKTGQDHSVSVEMGQDYIGCRVQSTLRSWFA